MNKELSNFGARLREAISSGGLCFVNAPIDQGSDEARPSMSADAPFNHHALGLFSLQFKYNAAVTKICEARGLTPEVVDHWTQIPAVPTAAFKELELSCLPPAERIAVFHSSGTTEQKPSRHFHNKESLAVYAASLWPWFLRHVVPEFGIRNSEFGVLILTPPPAGAPHSSLVHMFETVRREFGAPESAFVGKTAADGTWMVDFNSALSALNSSLVTRHSLLLLGTAFSFVHLLDCLSEHGLQFHLPAGSRVMETGGYKNRSRTMPKEKLQALIAERLGVSAENIICEYGMSELSSQAYDSITGRAGCPQPAGLRRGEDTAPCLRRNFCFPPWVRVQIISPETGREVADGETGLIRIFDLANVFSVMAIQTEDWGIRRGEGFELLGRAAMAEPRGCSLMNA
jgi:Acyl-protein synthetase, LuxE